MVEFKYAPMFQLGPDETEYYKLTGEYVSVGEFEGKPILRVDPEGLTLLANVAYRDVNFQLRPAHNRQLLRSDDRTPPTTTIRGPALLRNAEVSAKGNRSARTPAPIIHAERPAVWTGFDDAEALKVCSDLHRRVFATAKAPLTMYQEVNTKCACRPRSISGRRA